MHNAFVTTGHLTKSNMILLDESLPADLDFVKIIIEPIQILKKKNGHRRKLGLLKGKIRLADDFDAPSDDFNEYMC